MILNWTIGETVRRLVMAMAVLALVVAGCGDADGTAADGDPLGVVATTTIVGDIVQNVVGEHAEVTVLLPLGADPHDYQLSSQQVAQLSGADLVVVNGLGLEGGIDDTLEGAIEDGAHVLSLGELLDPLPFGTHDGHDDAAGADDHDAGEYDPHFWFDPERVADAADLIADGLAGLDPSVDWSANATSYRDALTDAEAEIAAMFAGIPEDRRKLVTNHDSLGYLADRYGFEVIGTVVPGGSTLADPSSAELAALVEEIEREGVPAVFAETTEPTRIAEAIAAEVGAEMAVVELYTGSLGEPGSGAETLIGMLLINAALIAEALG